MKTIGSRAEVMHCHAIQTSGGLTLKDLKYTDDGRIVSKKQQRAGKKNPGLKAWRKAVKDAKKELDIPKDEFVPIKGQLLRKTRSIYKKK